MPKGNYFKTLMVNFIARNTPATPFPQLYLALYSTNPGDTDTGTEANYVGYARVPVVFGAPTLVGGNATSLNTQLLQFGVVPIASGNISYAALRTAASPGANDYLAYYAPLAATYQLQQGVQPIVPIGSLSISEA